MVQVTRAAVALKVFSCTIDGETVVVGPDGLSLFDELRRRNSARSAILYAFDLIEHNSEDLRGRPFLERKEALAWLLAGSKAASYTMTISRQRAPQCSLTPANSAPRASRQLAALSRRGPVMAECRGGGAGRLNMRRVADGATFAPQ
jgi:hypothetical protein